MEMDTKKITQEPYDKADLDEAVETLRRGGIILYPTDTVWGIGCDATNEEAVRRIYELKRREDSKSMLVLVGETYEVERLVSEVPEVAYDLMELAVRPITIIYPHATGVAPNLLGEGGLSRVSARAVSSSPPPSASACAVPSSLPLPTSVGSLPRSSSRASAPRSSLA